MQPRFRFLKLYQWRWLVWMILFLIMVMLYLFTSPRNSQANTEISVVANHPTISCGLCHLSDTDTPTVIRPNVCTLNPTPVNCKSNPYGAAIQSQFAGRARPITDSAIIAAALATVSPLDSDGDGWANGQELENNGNGRPGQSGGTPDLLVAVTTDKPVAVKGDLITFIVTARNTSNHTAGPPFLNIAPVTDLLGSTCGAPSQGQINQNEITTIRCTLQVLNAHLSGNQLSNRATVVGALPSGKPLSRQTNMITLDVASLTVDSTVDKPTVDNVDNDVTLTYVVTNDGGVPLLVTVANTDPRVRASACGETIIIGEIIPAQTVTKSCTVADVLDDINNNVTVSGEVIGGAGGVVATVTRTDNVAVNAYSADVDIDIALVTPSVIHGEPITYTVTVTNNSDTGGMLDVTLNNVQVRAPQQPICNRDYVELAQGAKESYLCMVIAQSPTTGGLFTTALDVTGTVESVNRTITDTAQFAVQVEPRAPALSLTITPIVRRAASGERADFIFAVNNTGNVALNTLAVTVPKAPTCNTTIAVLAAKSAQSYQCSTIIADEFIEEINGELLYAISASVAGVDRFDNAVYSSPVVSAELTASQFVLLPLVFHAVTERVDLVVDAISVNPFGVEVVIKNTGNVTIAGVGYWVDLYINPIKPPTVVNQIASDWGGKGLVWGVTANAPPLVPGGKMRLRIGDDYYVAHLSAYPSQLAAQSKIYVQVDSVNTQSSYGALLEEHEGAGDAYNNISVIELPEAISTGGWHTSTATSSENARQQRLELESAVQRKTEASQHE